MRIKIKATLGSDDVNEAAMKDFVKDKEMRQLFVLDVLHPHADKLAVLKSCSGQGNLKEFCEAVVRIKGLGISRAQILAIIGPEPAAEPASAPAFPAASAPASAPSPVREAPPTKRVRTMA